MRLRNARKNAKEIERERYCKNEAGDGEKRARARDIEHKKNIYIIYVTALLYREGSFYEQARKAVYSPVRSNKVSGKPLATLPPLT